MTDELLTKSMAALDRQDGDESCHRNPPCISVDFLIKEIKPSGFTKIEKKGLMHTLLNMGLSDKILQAVGKFTTDHIAY